MVFSTLFLAFFFESYFFALFSSFKSNKSNAVKGRLNHVGVDAID